ncbi:Esterase CM06B1 [Toxocara canis]|uniref:Carboxylic ester hydrolase n=2 Tax=Toxocara canis TaxID=6265 RepID=A0A0B2VXY3_TOXCA|nr:Esterase CM06B1 [Toxocara canis]VDM43317.1 unnamed protein product [Toxocara canis]
MGSLVSYFSEHRFVPSDVFKTKNGKVRGKKFDISDGDGRFVNAFLGIPYAKAPIGVRRFKEAEPPEQWNGIRECTKHAPRAPQLDMFFERLSTTVPKSEDCLYLNVFAPDWDASDDQGRAVIVWIHGGAFVIHSSAHYGDYGICRYLCAKDVVVVTLQYRLGLLGFTTTGDVNSISNLGLRDQVAALRWVKENIAFFGGDPDNITVSGQSAGGACADILALSPYSRDLFHKVIPMSGNASCNWAIRDIAHVRNTIRAHAKVLGWEEPEGEEFDKNASLMEFLRHQPVSALEISFDGKSGFKTNAKELDIVPVVDGDFIPESVDELRRKAPTKLWLIGVTEYEALLFAPLRRIRPYYDTLEQLLNEKISDSDYFDAQKLRDQAREIYVAGRTSQEGFVRSLMRLSSDLLITNAAHNCAVELMSAGHTVYLYNFKYFTPNGLGWLGWLIPFYGATHCMELPYLFGKGILANFNPTDIDLEVLEHFTLLFTNFAKYGEPNGGHLQGLKPIIPLNVWRHICIDESIGMKENFHGRRAQFWRSLKSRSKNDSRRRHCRIIRRSKPIA